MAEQPDREGGSQESSTTMPKTEREAQAPAPAAAETAASATTEPDASVTKKAKVRGHRVASSGVAHIRATFNNTLVCIADSTGAVVAWCSSGRAGFKGCRKSTAFAATVVAQDAARQAVAKGMREVEVRVQGAGSGRESAVRAIQSAGMSITAIKDVTPVPHNGCRPRKRRRV